VVEKERLKSLRVLISILIRFLKFVGVDFRNFKNLWTGGAVHKFFIAPTFSSTNPKFTIFVPLEKIDK
jgi:hypothetical protein